MKLKNYELHSSTTSGSHTRIQKNIIMVDLVDMLVEFYEIDIPIMCCKHIATLASNGSVVAEIFHLKFLYILWFMVSLKQKKWKRNDRQSSKTKNEPKRR